jgi:hypothetical protein
LKFRSAVVSQGKGLAQSPVELIGDDRTPLLYNAVGLFEEKFCRRFDRAVSHKRVGRRRLVTGADETKALIN